ncbi:M56 family metallopeptidase [Adhaeribacter rhizoryzae]|uniref:M56 family metallopeptidase n=1 Tax=Adhaeribacter rhizoryzae TaxID=2607907 RepID=A0A5M6DRY5_9BACT|nr:M56 family metallopeptidase [Adhaeribacter rhizoryzae]KAA5548165.1 M56 family metallopeptidase [Adhaeribacter rhizoryzae]
MAAFFLYNIKLSVCLGVIYLFYYLALRNLTFYNWNRFFFLLGTALCFLLPLINVGPFLMIQEAENLRIIKEIPNMGNLYTPMLHTERVAEPAYPIFQFILVLFGLGLLVQGGKLLIQFVSFFRLRRSATRLQHGALNIYQVDKDIAPFSFGNAIFLNKNLLQPAELHEIIRHEQVHINQKHTLDVLWLELLTLVNWYNPFVWLLKRAIRQNLEFIADREILLMPHSDKKYYQYLLLKVIGLPDFTIANQFNISSLKTRINMMNRMPSKQRESGRFLLVIPMLAFLLWACQDKAETAFKDLPNTEANKSEVQAGSVPEAPPPPPAPPAPLPETTVDIMNGKKDEPITLEAFFKRNPNIKNFTPILKNNTIVSAVVELKSGKKENYNFKNAGELAQFHQRYGYFPIHNPPPPPAPVVRKMDSDHVSFMKRNQQVAMLGWQGNETMVVFLKSGEREEYDLKNKERRAVAQSKFGKLPQAPPQPPDSKF